MKKFASIVSVLLMLLCLEAVAEDKVLFQGTYQHRYNNQDSIKTKVTLTEIAPDSFVFDCKLNNDTYKFSFSSQKATAYDYLIDDGKEFSMTSVFTPTGLLETRVISGKKASVTEYFASAEGILFFPVSRPDPFSSLPLLLKKIDLTKKEAQTIAAFDIDMNARNLVEYKLAVTIEADNGIALPNGKFNAKHIVINQVVDKNVRNQKSNKYGRIDVWFDENLVPLRVFRFKDGYDYYLTDYSNPSGLISADEKMTGYRPPKDVMETLQPSLVNLDSYEGDVVFSGNFSHRYNNMEVGKEKLTIKKAKDGSLVFISDFVKNAHIAYFDASNVLTKYIVKLSEEDEVLHTFLSDKVVINVQDKTIEYAKSPESYPDLNTRPDPFLFQLSFLKKIDLSKTDPVEFTLFDREKKSDKYCEYKVKVRNLGVEEIQAGKELVKAHHIQCEQLSSPDTFIKKDLGMMTDYWITSEGYPVKISKQIDAKNNAPGTKDNPEAGKYVRVLVIGGK